MRKHEIHIFDHQNDARGLFGLPLEPRTKKKHVDTYSEKEEAEMEDLIQEAIYDNDPESYDLDDVDINGYT